MPLIATAKRAGSPSLLKNLSDHRVRSSATVTIGHAQNFVRSRNPITVIIKIESTILTGDPRLGAAPSNE